MYQCIFDVKTEEHHSSNYPQAYKELGLMMVLVGVAVLTFASLVFFVERDSDFEDGKWTFLDSVWWGILTVTTVGHHVKSGENIFFWIINIFLFRSPQTFTGKLLGGFCALAGTFILTLPIPIVVNRCMTV